MIEITINMLVSFSQVEVQVAASLFPYTGHFQQALEIDTEQARIMSNRATFGSALTTGPAHE
jgi:hypothetical protein